MAVTISGSTGIDKVVDGSIAAVDLAANAVTTAKIADDAITLAKMAPGTDGNLITYDASQNPAYVATGTAGQLLTSAGTGAPPTFTTVSSGGITLLSTVATTSGTSNATGTLNLTGFRFVYIDCYSIRPATDSAGYLRFTPNGGTGTYFLDVSRTAAGTVYFGTSHNLDSGFFYGSKRAGGGGGINDTTRNGISNSDCMGHNTGLSAATTSISFDYTTGEAFQGGTIRIYGLK
jgi:hypothetical protein